MACEHVTLPGGGTAIICGSKRHFQKCRCGNRATLLCDWKIPGADEPSLVKVSGTCDAPLCPRCTSSPAPEKDLCPKHAAMWAKMREARGK